MIQPASTVTKRFLHVLKTDLISIIKGKLNIQCNLLLNSESMVR